MNFVTNNFYTIRDWNDYVLTHEISKKDAKVWTEDDILINLLPLLKSVDMEISETSVFESWKSIMKMITKEIVKLRK